jgi:DNA repair photolyase
MPLNKARGNMYEFVTHTWNPIKGDCPHDCSYCYVKRIYKRFKKEQGVLRLDEKELKTNLGKGNFIFVGSSCDMFADDVDQFSILRTLDRCRAYADNRYLFQTRNVRGTLSFIFPVNTVIGTTIETNRYWLADKYSSAPSVIARVNELQKSAIHRKMITMEPIMDFDVKELVGMVSCVNPVQVNIGADSGRNHLPEPPAEKVLELIAELEKVTKVVQKPNLARLLKC